MNKTTLMDDFEPLDRGFCSVLRNKDYFLFFSDVFDVMNKLQHELYRDGPQTDTYFLDRTFKATVVGQNWLKIKTLYERGHAPFKASAILAKNPLASEGGKSHEEIEYTELLNALNVIYPAPKGPDQDIRAFASFFRSRPTTQSDADFMAAKEMLEVNCQHIASVYTPGDIELQTKNPMKSIEVRDERLRRVKSIFSRGASNIVSGGSQTMLDLLMDEERVTRLPTFSGSEWNSFDAILGGLPGIGLTTAIGGTGGGKTLWMSSLVGNRLLNAAQSGLKAPKIWGFIGEDGVESYGRRAIGGNLMNRCAAELGFSQYNLSELGVVMKGDPRIRAIYQEFVTSLFANTEWIKAPEKPEEKLNFSIINILNAFDAKLDATGERPELIILDYFNLLTLPRGMSSNNTAKDLSMIAHLLDDWAQSRGVPILTAVQASISGVQQARDGLRFFELEDQHESKSIAHSSRMVISLLPHTVSWDERGMPVLSLMGVKVLKNRGGRKFDIFLSPLDEGKNIAFSETRVLSRSEWMRHKTNIMEKEQALLGDDFGQGDKSKGAKGFGNKFGGGGGNKGGGGNQGGYAKGGGKQASPIPGTARGPVDTGEV